MSMSRKDTLTTSRVSEMPDERVDLDDAFFANARVRRGGKIVREATGTLAKRGRPPKAEGEHKQKVTLRLSPEVVAFFKAQGAGWQSRIDAALAEIARRG
jgi:uncharacterized protein (DUF4415 family)